MRDQLLKALSDAQEAWGWKDAAFCREAEVGPDTLRNFRRKEGSLPDGENLTAILRVLRASPAEIEAGTYTPPMPPPELRFPSGKDFKRTDGTQREPRKPLRLTTRAPDLTDARPLSETAAELDLPDVERMPKNVPVVGWSQGGDGLGWFHLNGQISDYVRRPPGIAHLRDVVATYVVGDSMRPWREQGELVYLHPTRPARTGDYVVLDLYGEDDEPGPALLKRLVAKTPTVYRLGQWNPFREDIEIEAVRVRKVWRVIDWSELLGM